MNKGLLLAAALTALSSAVWAQTPTGGMANPISMSEKGLYGYVSGAVIAAAEKMPEANYSFQPTPDVRTFAQLVGHAADAQYMMCGSAGGQKPQMKMVEKNQSSKTELVAALKDAVNYCMGVYGGMTDADGAQMVKMMGFSMAKLTVLSMNTAHLDEHYGNMVTYLRIKGIVPPTSEKGGPGGKP